MRKYLLLVWILILANSCSSYFYSQKQRDVCKIVVKAFIENRKSKIKIDSKENVLTVGASVDSTEKDSYNIVVAFINPKLLSGFEYSKVYMIDGFKLIIDESTEFTNKPDILKKLFKEVEYENFNLSKIPINYNYVYWQITFNSKNEVIRISPFQKSQEIKEILLKRGVKFSKDFGE